MAILNNKRPLRRVLAVLFLSACASPQQKLTGVALSGDTAKLEAMLKPGVNIDAPALVNQSVCRSPGALSPLQAAACAGKAETVRVLLAHKADPNSVGQSGAPALLYAVSFGHEEAARILLEGGARAGAKGSTGNPALFTAAREGHFSISEMLLAAGAAVDGTDAKGQTALMVAKTGRIAGNLLEKGADISLMDSEGRTALLTAAARGQSSIARQLLEKGSDSTLTDAKGLSALALARAGRDGPTISLFEKEARRLLKGKLASGDRAAAAGDVDAAMAVYTAAMKAAGDLGGGLEEDIRIKIIRYAAGLKNPPTVPSEAREHLVRANYLIKKGRNATEVEREMAAAVEAAPWWAEGYYNLGLVQADRGKFVEAMATLNLFIQAAPASPKAQSAQDKIYELKIAKEEADAIAGMTGSWNGWYVKVSGSQLTITSGRKTFKLTMKQNILTGSLESTPYPGSDNCTIPGQLHPATGKVSDDLKNITLEHNWSTYDTRSHCVDMFGLASNCCLMCSKVCDAVSVVSTTKQHVQIRR